MVTKKRIWVLVSLITIEFILYAFIGERYLYARSFASELFKYPLPPKTNVVNKDFDYGIFYGGGPWGSGGRPTVAAYMEIESELNAQELYDYYNKINVFSEPGSDNKRIGFELYFDGDYEKNISDGKVWYEGTQNHMTSEKDTGKPIKAIVQIRTEFSHPFLIDFN